MCPFCQQGTDVSLEKSLNEYFDDAFAVDSAAIEDLYVAYKTEWEQLHGPLQGLLDYPPEYFDAETLQNQSDLLDSKIQLNFERLEEKRREPSKSVELDVLGGILDEIKKLLEATNAESLEHNITVENVNFERSKLTEQVWRYLLDYEISEELALFETKKRSLEKAIASLNEKIRHKTKEHIQKQREIATLERDTTSIQPTIDAINALLKSFGFQGFVLEKSDRNRFYKIRRPDGSDARDTLSEGEGSFIAFLYFYHLAKGSASESGVTVDRVVVFDDPVSSLDSNVLFVVSSLIKDLFNEVRDKRGAIKQIFVLTHNMYFHKEVSFESRRSGDHRKLNDETFWTVRKSGLVSKIESHCTNPINSTYESLWMEVKRDDRNSPSLQNTLRRILEYYFNILGGVNPDSLCTRFSGPEKLICKSLFSWVNAGSHSVYDDPYFSPDESTADLYLTVFKDVFEKTGHMAHYNMMMGDSADGE